MSTTTTATAVTVSPDTTKTTLAVTKHACGWSGVDAHGDGVGGVARGEHADRHGDVLRRRHRDERRSRCAHGHDREPVDDLHEPGEPLVHGGVPGDPNENTSTSTARAVTVNPVSTKTAVTFVSTPVVVGQSLDLVATVSVVSPGVSTPTGTVTFTWRHERNPAGQRGTHGPTATLPWAFTSAGSHSITAVYSGDTNDKTSAARDP